MNGLVEDFEKNGFVIVRQLITESEVARVKSDIRSVFLTAGRPLAEAQGLSADEMSLNQIYKFLLHKSPALKSKCYDILGKLNSILAIFSNEKVDNLISSIYHQPLILNSVQVRLDDGSNDFILPWHQETNQISLLTANLWMPLVDLSDNMGGLEFCPGSHKLGLCAHEDKDDLMPYDRLPTELVDQFETVSFQPNAGDALIFHPFLFHRSLTNTSDQTRITVVGRLNELSTAAFLKDEHAPLLIPRNPDTDLPYYRFIERYQSGNQ